MLLIINALSYYGEIKGMVEENEKVSELQNRIVELEALLSDVRGEAARSRVARNNERKKVFALSDVIRKHNVNFSVDEQDLSSLKISENDGSVVGEFSYQPPEIMPDLPKASSRVETLTADDIPHLSVDEINNRWSEIEALGKAGALN